MDEAVSAAEANRKFSALLRGVRSGRRYVVTSHGKPIARIVPPDRDHDIEAAARKTLLERLESQPVTNIGSWSRDELYENEP